MYIMYVRTVNVYNVYHVDESTNNRVLQEMLEASGMDWNPVHNEINPQFPPSTPWQVDFGSPNMGKLSLGLLRLQCSSSKGPFSIAMLDYRSVVRSYHCKKKSYNFAKPTQLPYVSSINLRRIQIDQSVQRFFARFPDCSMLFPIPIFRDASNGIE